MSLVRLDIQDPILRATLKAMLQAAGHDVVRENAGVVLTDDCTRAIEWAASQCTVVAVHARDIPRAVAAMGQGVYGYIFLPLQPGEADIAVRHATQTAVHAPDDDTPVPALREVEMEHIRRVLRRCKGNHTEAARLLGIGRNTLWRRLARHPKETGSA